MNPRHRCDAQHSWHTRNERSEDRKDSSQNKGTTFSLHTRQSPWETRTTTTTN